MVWFTVETQKNIIFKNDCRLTRSIIGLTHGAFGLASGLLLLPLFLHSYLAWYGMYERARDTGKCKYHDIDG